MVWTTAGEPVAGIVASKKNLSSVAFSPDNACLATAGLGDDIHIWSLPDGQPAAVLSGHKTAVGSLAFLDQGRKLVSWGYDQTVRVWDAQSWRQLEIVPIPEPGARWLALSPDQQFGALSMEGRVPVWRLFDWATVADIDVDAKVISSLAFSADNRWLAVGGADRRIRIWDFGGGD